MKQAHEIKKIELLSIGTGVIANQNINCYRAYENGWDMITKIIGVDFGSRLAQDKNNIFFRKPAKGKTPAKIYSPKSFKHGQCVLENILFIHAFSGYDTTSSFYSFGKFKFIKTLEKNPELRSSAELFKQENGAPEILTYAGERFLIALYGGDKDHKSINTLRFHCFTKLMTKNKSNPAG